MKYSMIVQSSWSSQLLKLVRIAFLFTTSLDFLAGRTALSHQRPRSHAAPCQPMPCFSRNRILCFSARMPVPCKHSAVFFRGPNVKLVLCAQGRPRLSIRMEVTNTASFTRQGAEQGSLCSVCYAPQGSGHKFCISCGAPQLIGGGIVRHWTTEEARAKQFTNTAIGVSSCGPASVLTALSMIGSLPLHDNLLLIMRCSSAD
jgi:hypothetical protein